MQELKVVDKSFQDILSDYLDDLFSPGSTDGKGWEKMAREFIESYYEINVIPSISEIIEGMLEENINVIHGIAMAVLDYKQAGVMCDSDIYGGCHNCPDYEDCYDGVIENCMEHEFFEETSPLQMAWGLYEILYRGDLCVYLNEDDIVCYGDITRYYDYDNEEVLWNYFKGFDPKEKPMAIINHAQQTMFDDLYLEGAGNCFNYGRKFILIHDSFNEKYATGYYLAGGN